ncbi:MAG: DUF559 domain-containing protein [Deltaproteobacteria bacterium]|nr:DUF559 domain-containing protein [Deltaproteobacteria bacterium]
MRQPEILARVHSPEVAAKRGLKRRAWLASGSTKAKAEIARIRKLNPSLRPDVRAKISASLRAMGHRPAVRGGNGKGPTLPQRVLFELLGGGWYMEYAVSLGSRRRGYPTCYKVDLGNPSLMLAVEVDGFTHGSRRDQDMKKDTRLMELGWRVLRFSNQEVLSSAHLVVDRIRSHSTISR